MKKSRKKIVMITAYDALFGALFDPIVDVLLVGDSLVMSFGGKSDTLGATMDQMIYHTQAVCAGRQKSLVLFDMPFGSYTDRETALKNAVRVYQETGADAVKLEGGKEKAEIVRHLSQNAIAVFGHIGLMPQHVRSEGEYSVKGRSEADKQAIIEDALALERSGAVALIIEGVMPDVALAVTQQVSIPTIGIGAGAACDGQVLVWSDMVGLFGQFVPKFVKQYIQAGELIQEAVGQYASEVRSGHFPDVNHQY